jgi:hypothetical protein
MRHTTLWSCTHIPNIIDLFGKTKKLWSGQASLRRSGSGRRSGRKNQTKTICLLNNKTIRGGIDDHHSLNSLYIMMAIRGGIDDHHSLNSPYIMMAIRRGIDDHHSLNSLYKILFIVECDLTKTFVIVLF